MYSDHYVAFCRPTAKRLLALSGRATKVRILSKLHEREPTAYSGILLQRTPITIKLNQTRSIHAVLYISEDEVAALYCTVT